MTKIEFENLESNLRDKVTIPKFKEGVYIVLDFDMKFNSWRGTEINENSRINVFSKSTSFLPYGTILPRRYISLKKATPATLQSKINEVAELLEKIIKAQINKNKAKESHEQRMKALLPKNVTNISVYATRVEFTKNKKEYECFFDGEVLRLKSIKYLEKPELNKMVNVI